MDPPFRATMRPMTPQVLQNRVTRYYLGGHKFTPVTVTCIIMDWPDMKSQHWTEIIRYKNRLSKMDENKLLVNLYRLEKSLKITAWVKNMKHTLHYCNMPECTDLSVTCDLDVLSARLLRLNRERWWLEDS